MGQEKKATATPQDRSPANEVPGAPAPSAGQVASPPPLPSGSVAEPAPEPDDQAPETTATEDVLAEVFSKPFPLPESSAIPAGSQLSTVAYRVPPPIPHAGGADLDRGTTSDGGPAPPGFASPADHPGDQPARRAARRRPAGPVRTKIAANDDAPSIGGLIYALDQKPSSKPFKYAGIATGVWTVICATFAWFILRADLEQGITFTEILAKPTTFLTVTAIVAPMAILWFLALLAWRSEELRLRSSTMTEVAIRLAEPDRMAEQSVASLGQAVRRQVSFMNDAISRALGRAGELEALVHNEVSALERSYEENERKIRGLINELSGERNALLDTSERVTDTLRALGTDIPTLIEKLSSQQMKLAGIIQGAGENLASLETAVGQTAHRLETVVDNSTLKLESTLSNRTNQLQGMLDVYTHGLSDALGARTEQLQDAIEGYVKTLDHSLTMRTENLQAVFEEYGRALDTSLTNRAQALDIQLVERTKALDTAFAAQLRSFDDSIMRSTLAIDSAVADRARALTNALDNHAKTFSETISRQAVDLDESLMQGINSVRRTSENITRQSLKAIEGLAGHSEMLKNVSQNLLAQINTVTGRFENQGQQIMRAANALENANFKIDATLQGRHADLNNTLERLSGKADEFGRFVEGYSSTIEGSLTDAEARARAAAEQLLLGTETTKRTALQELERLKMETGSESDRTLDELRRRFSSISSVVNEELSSLTTRFDATSEDVRQRATRAAQEIAAEQARLRDQMEKLPTATRESTEAMRRALNDQLRAIEQLSTLASRSVQSRDVTPPLSSAGPTAPQGLTGSYAAEQRSLSSLMHTQSDPLRGQPPQRSPLGQQALPRPPAGGPPEGREGWSLGDLLARASRDEEAAPRSSAPAPAPGPAVPLHNQIEVIARALDPSATAALWARINTGQHGVMARSIYSPEGRAAFDDLSRRYHSDPELQRTINHYLSDFENLRRDAELRDPSGRAVNAHLMSEMGRVYLFLAHVTGRIT